MSIIGWCYHVKFILFVYDYVVLRFCHEYKAITLVQQNVIYLPDAIQTRVFTLDYSAFNSQWIDLNWFTICETKIEGYSSRYMYHLILAFDTPRPEPKASLE